MFKDKKEELQRLEAALLEEEPEEETEDYLDADTDFGEETEETYYNYSNHYGCYDAYNPDISNEALEDYTDEVLQGKKDRLIPVLWVVAMGLLAGIFCVLAWWAVRFLGR